MGVLDPIVNAPRSQKLILGAMVLVIVGALGYFFLIPGARAERDSLLAENEVRRAEVLKAKAAADRHVLSEVPIEVTAECTYHQLGAFLDRVGKMPRIVALGEFRLIAIDRPTGTLRAEMTLATYTFRGEGAPPPPAKPGAPAPPPAPVGTPAPAGSPAPTPPVQPR